MATFQKVYISAPDSSSPAQLQRVINTVQQNIENSFNRLDKVSILNNVIFDGVLINGNRALEHKLGRKPVGYIIIQKTGNINIWNGSIDENILQLFSSGSVTASIMVF